MKSVNSFFEQKILFRINRYFYNLTAFGGFLAILGGGILFTQSFEKEVLTVDEWRKKGEKLEKVNESYFDYEQRLNDFNMNAVQNREDSQFLVLGGFETSIFSEDSKTTSSLSIAEVRTGLLGSIDFLVSL